MLLRDDWVLVSKTWRILWLRMMETAYDMEGSCEYSEREVADIRSSLVLHHERLGEETTTALRKKLISEEIDWTASQTYRFFERHKQRKMNMRLSIRWGCEQGRLGSEWG